MAEAGNGQTPPDTQGTPGREWLSLGELAAALGVSKSTLYRHGVHEFGLVIGSVRRYRVQDVLDALDYAQSE